MITCDVTCNKLQLFGDATIFCYNLLYILKIALFCIGLLGVADPWDID